MLQGNGAETGDVPGDVFLAVLAALESDGVALEEIALKRAWSYKQKKWRISKLRNAFCEWGARKGHINVYISVYNGFSYDYGFRVEDALGAEESNSRSCQPQC